MLLKVPFKSLTYPFLDTSVLSTQRWKESWIWRMGVACPLVAAKPDTPKAGISTPQYFKIFVIFWRSLQKRCLNCWPEMLAFQLFAEGRSEHVMVVNAIGDEKGNAVYSWKENYSMLFNCMMQNWLHKYSEVRYALKMLKMIVQTNAGPSGHDHKSFLCRVILVTRRPALVLFTSGQKVWGTGCWC